MKLKTFRLHFRYRDARNELFDVFEEGQTTSKEDAKRVGKRLAEERAPAHAGKYWFIGID